MSGASGKPVTLGLAGGIGSGKSAVARLLGEMGALVIDADAIAHRILERPAVAREIARRWGREVLDAKGRVRRSELARRLTAGNGNRGVERLNAITHPLIRAEMRRLMRLAARKNDCPLVALDAPLLLESGLDEWCDAVAYVAAPRAQRLRRAARSAGMTPEELARRERWQMTLAAKRRRCRFVIDNGGSLTETRTRTRRLFRRLTKGNPRGIRDGVPRARESGAVKKGRGR